jgi:hypothetical protein
MVRLDMSEYMEKHTVSRLIGERGAKGLGSDKSDQWTRIAGRSWRQSRDT